MKLDVEQIKQLNNQIATNNLNLNQEKNTNSNVNVSFTNMEGGQPGNVQAPEFNSKSKRVQNAPDQTYVI